MEKMRSDVNYAIEKTKLQKLEKRNGNRYFSKLFVSQEIIFFIKKRFKWQFKSIFIYSDHFQTILTDLKKIGLNLFHQKSSKWQFNSNFLFLEINFTQQTTYRKIMYKRCPWLTNLNAFSVPLSHNTGPLIQTLSDPVIT